MPVAGPLPWRNGAGRERVRWSGQARSAAEAAGGRRSSQQADRRLKPAAVQQYGCRASDAAGRPAEATDRRQMSADCQENCQERGGLRFILEPLSFKEAPTSLSEGKKAQLSSRASFYFARGCFHDFVSRPI